MMEKEMPDTLNEKAAFLYPAPKTSAGLELTMKTYQAMHLVNLGIICTNNGTISLAPKFENSMLFEDKSQE